VACPGAVNYIAWSCPKGFGGRFQLPSGMRYCMVAIGNVFSEDLLSSQQARIIAIKA